MKIEQIKENVFRSFGSVPSRRFLDSLHMERRFGATHWTGHGVEVVAFRPDDQNHMIANPFDGTTTHWVVFAKTRAAIEKAFA